MTPMAAHATRPRNAGLRRGDRACDQHRRSPPSAGAMKASACDLTSPEGHPRLRHLLFCSVLFDYPTYALDAVCDSSIWYYAAFGSLAAAGTVREPTFLPRLLRW
jgi:hypothetical protein